MSLLEAQTPMFPQKTVRILVYPNITYSKDYEKDSYVKYMSSLISITNQDDRFEKNRFYYVIVPAILKAFDFPNVKQLVLPIPTHPPAMRVHFDTAAVKKLLPDSIDIDLVYTNLPEHTLALKATIFNLTHHRPLFYGYSHWFDFEDVATWEGNTFLANISGILEMERCYVNTEYQREKVLAEAALTFNEATIQRLREIIVALPLHVRKGDVALNITPTTDKVIVFNHRPEPYKDWPRVLTALRNLRKLRQDFTVWVPLLPGTPDETWIDNTKYEGSAYFAKLNQCRVGIAPKQVYGGWSISATDGMMSGCPYIFFDAPYNKEIALGTVLTPTYDSYQELIGNLEIFLDNEGHRNHHAREQLAAMFARADAQSSIYTWQFDTNTMLDALPKLDTNASERIIGMIRQRGVMTKSEIMAELNWGRGIGFTPYRRAMLAHPNIYDLAGEYPTYAWCPT